LRIIDTKSKLTRKLRRKWHRTTRFPW